MAFASALALAACSTDPRLDPIGVLTPPSDAGLRRLVGRTGDLVVAGEHLNAGLLSRFYARHDFEPVWATRRAQAASLTAAVLRARDQGLDPSLFHATLLQREAALSPLQRDLVLSDAFLSYADALARGAVPVEHRRDDEVLAPEPIDVAAVLDDALQTSDPGKGIEALAPATPTYVALRQALQTYRSGMSAGKKASADHLRMLEVNLERQRWLPRRLPADRVWVNVAEEQLVMYQAGRPAFTTRVVVGEDVRRNQSPEFRATIDASFYNPPWVIPADIAKAEILPKLTSDPNYLTRNKMVMLTNGEVEQLPGPEAGLGYIMFDMPNRFDVYLHDTPDRYIFSRDNRRISHGCIRVQNPRELAALLMDRSVDAINQGIAAGDTTRNNLPTPIPVFVVYQTAFVDARGSLQFRPDFYSRDAAIWRLLQEPSQRRVVMANDDHRAPLSYLSRVDSL
ncbi:L,D-transpeptidase family protein [Acidisphaera sp. L21]|uniref:L,D-transpeptidase family protein n=1 Tax=Acidisphaera sp. L21 TaxID=1641851 RepID=UPI00131D1672|nr:L,D-transpeptidase family protein [Acidisphaera sp. L21]